LHKGDSLYAIDRIEEALICFDLICENHPDNYMGCVKAARCLLKMGKYGEANTCISKVLEKDETIVEALRIKAYISLKRGIKTEAKQWLSKILTIDPENSWALKMQSITGIKTH
jgi:tetratricopeptide (TPR) repeat protein